MTAATMIFSSIIGIDQELGSLVYNQYGAGSPFRTNGHFSTSNVHDVLEVTFEDNAVPAGEVELVLNAGPGIDRTKQIGSGVEEVSRVAIDLIPGGTGVTFNGIRD